MVPQIIIKKHLLRLLLLLPLLSCFSIGANAQFRELGFGIGGMTLSGDINPNFSFRETLPAAMVTYRKNYPFGFSLRYELLVGGIQGADSRTQRDDFAVQRNASFSAVNAELGALLEYNFMDFRSGKSGFPWTPYLFMGAALNYYQGTAEIAPPAPFPSTKYNFNTLGFRATESDGTVYDQSYTPFPLVIPLGFGFKYALNTYWTMNLEFGARLTFTDRMDMLSEDIQQVNKPVPSPQLNPQRDYYYPHDTKADVYYYFGISFSYGFFSVPCPHDFY
ncbi:hypothetical protein PEPS_03010 [Persicobacter psychrovividus]|uniref:DUF6089 domain-containing protein n=1 Tax=Persicobacter psychrovividus TaxID=387638 RepID=A0ABM7VAS8_9BACT|nr:hypothetical protein PEPS_03010 [Persicobacter psychrovividus]